MKRPSVGFVKLTHAVIDSEAFAASSSHATRLLIFLWRRHNGKNNGFIKCSVREAATWLHSSKATASAAFVELQERGLVEAVTRGHFTVKAGGAKSVATTWRLLVIPPESKAHAQA